MRIRKIASLRRFLLFATVAIAATALSGIFAQEGDSLPSAPPRSLVAAKSLLENIAAFNKELIEKRKGRSNTALSEVERKNIDAEIDSLNSLIAEEQARFDSVVTGIDLDSFREQADSAVVLETELRQLLEPFMRELRKATARPRETEQLRDALATLKNQKNMATDAVANLKTLQTKVADSAVKKAIQAKLEEWEESQDRTIKQLSVAQFQLEERLRKEESVFESITAAVTSFFRTRGRNALSAIAFGLLTFLILRVIHRQVHRFSPVRRRGKRSLAVRLVDVVYYLFTVVMAIIVALGGLYIMGDWMLLGLSLVVLTGIVWAGKQSVAVFFEQVKLMLNLGSTREGERIIYNGIPWTVDTIQLYCDLVNPQLKGGHLRLPLRDVVALVSREADPDEYLFPCNEGEWIILSDGIFGKVIQQTPEWVQLVLLGGSRMNYATSEFIGLTPRNLSTGFRLQVLFGVDYQHQKDSTEEIPNKMRLSVEKGLLETVKEGELVHLRVELAEAAASSLNYAIIADFSGKSAPQYNMLERAIQRMCVEACNSHGWTIPFTQVTVHQAESPSQLNK